MINPFELLEARLLNIETLLIDIKHPLQITETKLNSVKELSVYAGVSELTIRNWIKEGKIEAKRIGRRILIDQHQFKKGLSEVKSLKYKR
ncbi:excisionase family DNA binding protein [Flavobacterium sp. 103]|uniref:excisionase family DNA-binding protein n=1 Tax=Flavobacterium sp. 103 TaxID=2135624 RepID=UPI000D5F6C3F|nr:excisionase family DNA-binding protein [Flavobacterium sp. 103]PVX47220.1 excisionase family DNA binding protein [Flavobacterium sp. 103]